jgi:tight adherence protein B
MMPFAAALSPLAVAIGVGLGTLALVIAGYLWVARGRLRAERLLRARLQEMIPGAAPVPTAILRGEAQKSVIDRLFDGRQFASAFEEEVRRAGLQWTPGQFVMMVAAGLLVGLVSSVALGMLVGSAISLLGALLPFVLLSTERRKRERKIELQLPDAIDMLVNALRAGSSLQAAMNFVGTEMLAPIGPEFARFYDEQRLGMEVRQALENLQERLGTLDARMMVLAMIIQRETGGNLAEILGNISRVVRERIEFRGQVEVLTAEARVSSIVLGLLPVVLYVAIRAANPEYIAVLTASETGRLLLGYAAGSLVIGFALLRQMARVEM